MAAKVGGSLGKLLGVVFTSIIAPVVVDLAVHDLHGEPDRPAATPAPAGEVACVLAQGDGATPEEALQNALRAALWRAAASRVEASTWKSDGPALFEGLCRDSRGLILGWKEVAAARERRLRGTVHHEEVAVTLNVRLLDERLHAAPTRGWNQVAQAPQ